MMKQETLLFLYSRISFLRFQHRFPAFFLAFSSFFLECQFGFLGIFWFLCIAVYWFPILSSCFFPCFSQTVLKVFLNEAEERDPRFEQLHYRFSVPENQAGVLVGRVELKPRKLRVNALMRYSIVNTEMRSLFNISSVNHPLNDVTTEAFLVLTLTISSYLDIFLSIIEGGRDLHSKRIGQRD